MTVNQLMAKLRTEQKAGNGKLDVHMLAHDNCLGETQGTVSSVSYFEKSDEDDCGGMDKYLYKLLPDEVVYLHG